MKYASLAALALAACATATGGAERTRAPPALAPGVQGGIAWYRNDGVLMKEAVWGDGRVAAGPRGGPAWMSIDRLADGRWRTGVTVIEVGASRLSGPQVDVTSTRVEGGFRLTGTWFQRNVDLVLDGKGARAQQFRYVRDADGAYVSGDLPSAYVFLVGEAARLEDPPWPELALTALVSGWGVQDR